MIRPPRTWLVPLLCFSGAFAAGYVAFHPSWRKAPALTDGSSPSFKHAPEIEKEDLIGRSSPHERVRLLFEICQKPATLTRDHALYEAIQKMQPADFISAIADLPDFARRFEKMDEETRTMFLEAGLERWLEVDSPGVLTSLATIREVVHSKAVPLPSISSSDLATTYRVLAAREPEWFREQIEQVSLREGDLSPDLAMEVLMSAETKRDPRNARKWLETLRSSKNWESVHKEFVMALSESEPRAAIEMVVAEDNKGDLVRGLFEKLAGQSPAIAAEMLSRVDPEWSRHMGWTATSLVEQGGWRSFLVVCRSACGRSDGC